jgi:Cof subfamily protein (haloacid dehalogenase superfamily)
LLHSDHTISPRTVKALTRAQEVGIKVMIASGRSPRSVHKVIDHLGGFVPDLTICCNGAIIYDAQQRRVLQKDEISVDVARTFIQDMLKVLPNAGIACEITTETGTEFRCNHEFKRVREKYIYYEIEEFEDSLKMLEGVVGSNKILILCQGWKPAEMYAVCPQEYLDREYSPVTISYSNSFQLEISAQGITKGSALSRYCEARGITQDQVAVFGDEMNDYEMVAWAGTSIVMSNGSDRTKSVATKVTVSNDEDGVAVEAEALLEKYYP